MNQIKYKEQWMVRIDNKSFVVNSQEKEALLSAMSNGERYVKLKSGDVLSVRHISYIYLHDRQIKDQLAEGSKNREYTKEDREMAFKKLNEIRKKYPLVDKVKKHEKRKLSSI